MDTLKFEIGNEVVRSKGDYVVGRIGNVVAIDTEKNRAQVEWKGETKTWVSFGSLELTSIPYEIIEGSYNAKTGKHTWSKYVRKAPQSSTNDHSTEKVMYNGVEVEAINFGPVV